MTVCPILGWPHLDQGVTVFAADIAELGREIRDYQNKWQMTRALAKLERV